LQLSFSDLDRKEFSTKMDLLEQLLAGVGAIHSDLGYTQEIQQADGRSFLLHTPHIRPASMSPLLLFAHGARGWCWDHALRVTRLLDLCAESSKAGRPFALVFLQADWRGELPSQRPRLGRYSAHPGIPHGRLGFGEFYWGIREPELSEEVRYVQRVVDDVAQRLAVDRARIYFFGHSNGGILACSLAIRLSNTLAALGCSMGGWRGNMSPELPGFIDICSDTRPVPLYVVTGDRDAYRQPCERARDTFLAAGHPVCFRVLPETGHAFQPCCEAEACNFLFSYRLPDDLSELWTAAAALRVPCVHDLHSWICQVSSKLSEDPSLTDELCTTDTLACLLALLSETSGILTTSILSCLVLVTSQAGLAQVTTPSFKRYLWNVIDRDDSDDALRDVAANLLEALSHSRSSSAERFL